MPRPLKLLLVEDKATDAELLIQTLVKAGFDPTWHCVDTEPEYLRHLDETLDLVISDYAMPHFSGTRALALLKQKGWELPFILVSGAVGEDTAVEAMKQGATDYLLKDRLARLGIVVGQVLDQASQRRERALAAAALHESDERYRLMFESNPQPMWVYDRQTLHFLAVNDAAVAAYGYSRAEFLGLTLRDIRPPEEVPFLKQDLAYVAPTGSSPRVWLHRKKDGTVVHVTIESHNLPFGERQGRLVAVHDETAREQAEQDLRATHTQLQHMLDHSPVVLYEANLKDGRIVPRMVSENIARWLGVAPSEALSRDWWLSRLHPEDRAAAVAGIAQTRAQGSSRTEYRLRHADGTFRWVEDSRQLARDARGNPSALVGVWTDITERKRAEAVLRNVATKQAGRESLKAIKEFALICGITALCAYVFALTDVLQAPVRAILIRHAENIDEIIGTLAVLVIGLGVFSYRQWRVARSETGQERNLQIALRTLHGELETRVQQRTGELASSNDALRAEVSERKGAEAALRSSEERFRELAENITEVFWLIDPAAQTLLYVSPAYATIWGRSCASLLAAPQTWMEAIHPEDRGRVRRAKARQEQADTYDEEYRIVRADGQVRWIHDRAFPVRDPAGAVYRVAGVAQDITEKKLMETQFYRAQRLESIGTLASGIAHDLNNILSPIMMSATLIRVSKSPENTEKVLRTIESSAERGAQLVRQLLTFGRGGIEGERKALSCGPLIREIETMARLTFPKNVTVVTAVAPDLRPVFADATQVHQILLNLCVNARDAMTKGGTLMIGAANAHFDADSAAATPGAEAGDYVRLSVADTGEGMTPEIIDKIFDPFFTTKGPGKGTGLGLATVMGLVKSHHGFMTVTSEPGRGSTFQVFLPIAADGSTATPFAPALVPLRGHDELVMVVDDEEAIREAVRGTLTKEGYTVLVAKDGAEGLACHAAAPREIKLVVTDFDMPNMDGLAMIRALKQTNPNLKFVVSSGVASHGQMSARQAELRSLGISAILPKPYTVGQLLQVVQRALHP